MKLLFAGTPLFAVPSLEAISRQYPICSVLTAPDKPMGRGRKNHFSPVKNKALELGLTLLQPAKLNSEFIENVKSLEPELLVVAAYGKIFKKLFLDIFPQGAVNVHPSLLPKYRGAAPIPAAILAGEKLTGVTIQRLALSMDAGDILMQREYALKGDENREELTKVLSLIGAELLVSVIDKLAVAKIKGIPQIEEEATYCKKVDKNNGQIDWNSSAKYIYRMMRAYIHWPGIFTQFKGVKLFLHKVGVYTKEYSLNNRQIGRVLGIDKEYGILIHTGKGILYIKELQLEYKKILDWSAFLNGHKDLIGSILGG